MTTESRTLGTSHAEAARGAYRVAIVGAASLRGKEVAEVLEQRNFPAAEVKLLDDDETLGQLEALKDEVTFIQAIRAEQFEHVDFTFFASDEESALKYWKRVRDSGSGIVDLSYALENEASARVRAPWLEEHLGEGVIPELQPEPAVVAHPVAIVLALLMNRLRSGANIGRSVAMVLEPASEYGQKGMDELHQQTVNLLSFQPLPKKLFDVQIAFNMIAQFGSAAAASLSSVERRIGNHYRGIMAPEAVIPSMFILQAPVFHGHALALNLQLEGGVELAKLSSALSGEHVSVFESSQEAPNNVNAAGQSDVLVWLAPDAFDSRSVWLWAAFDNLRVAAANAVECAELMAATRPRGQVQ
jgi:aspartate-semialdehyde dehydrogenase